MIRLNRWIRCGLAAGAILMTACVEDLTDVNQNPNAPTDVGPEFLLPQSIQVAVEQSFGSGLGMLSHTMIWPQQGVEIQYPDEEQGNVRPSSMQDYWDTYYSQSLQDIRTVIKKGRAANKPNVEAVGMIWETWLFHQLTDLFGDIPYSQALKGDEGTSAPAYDTQQQVYAGMIQTLKDAVAKLDANGAGVGNGDILYGNDFTKWRRFANSLRMRLAMRLSQVDANLARTEFIAANTAGGFLS
ncbi:MAG: SusD/RagB family nutrient-binding outer membrane lipoprotein, partial [Longimicrobiales bacterium]